MSPRASPRQPHDFSRPLTELRIPLDARLDGERLDVALGVHLHWRSRTSIQRLIADGFVSLGDRPAKASARVRTGDVVTVRIPPRAAPRPIARHDESRLRVLYEDRWLVAVDKPPHLAVHPAGRRLDGTLIHWLHQRYRRPHDPGHDVVPRLLHRLDSETSGIVVASLDELFHARVGAQFETRRVQKTYLAVVHGSPPFDAGLIDFEIGPARGSRVHLKMEARRDGSGLPALTRYAVRARHGAFTLLELRPRTGRQHQLRVHLAAIGCPIVGDKIYGHDETIFLEHIAGALSDANRERLVLDRHALHAHQLRFEHPELGRTLELESPLPEDLARLLAP
jgi:23S rRNA pseudouridine1911/1915/1917 synthase